MQNIDIKHEQQKNIYKFCIDQMRKKDYNKNYNETYIPKLEQLIFNWTN